MDAKVGAWSDCRVPGLGTVRWETETRMRIS